MTSNHVSPGLAVGLLLLCICITARSENPFTTVSGRDVPVHFIQKHFSKSLKLSDTNADLLSELTDDQVLLGPRLYIDQRKEARLVKIGNLSNSFTLDLNGKRKEAVPTFTKIPRARSYDIILDDHSGQVLSVSGNGVALTPLHQSAFPGILVNKRAFSKLGKDMPEHSHIPREDAGERTRPEIGFMENNSRDQTGDTCATGVTHYVEIAAAYDNTFCSLYGNDEAVATAALQSVFDKANAIFAVNTCIQLALVHIEAHCEDQNDPYASFSDFSVLNTDPCTQEERYKYSRPCSPAGLILSRFQNFWRDTRTGVMADAAFLFTGFDDGTLIKGGAKGASACSAQFGHGWIEGPDERTLAHEIGHTLGGTHTAKGIMREVFPTKGPFRFSDESVRQLTEYLDNDDRSSCVETANPIFDALRDVPFTTANALYRSHHSVA